MVFSQHAQFVLCLFSAFSVVHLVVDASELAVVFNVHNLVYFLIRHQHKSIKVGKKILNCMEMVVGMGRL